MGHVFRIVRYIGNIDYRAIENCSGCEQMSARSSRIKPQRSLQGNRWVIVMSDHVDELAIESVHRTKESITQFHRMLRDRIKHGLQISWSATNNPKNVTCRGLLLQRLGELAVSILQFLKQPDVFYGDDGLIGEGLKKCNLLVRKRSNLDSTNKNHPDRNPLPQQRSGQYRTTTHTLPGVHRLWKLGCDDGL